MLLIGVRSCRHFLSSYIFNATSNGIHVPEKWYLLCSKLLKMSWSIWDVAEENKKAKIAEESSLYRYSTTTHNIIEEAVEPEEETVRLHFPLYDTVFEEEIHENKPKMCEGEIGGDFDVEIMCQFTSSEMEEVASLHQLLFTSHAETKQSHTSTLLISKYSLAASLVDIIKNVPGKFLSPIFVTCAVHCVGTYICMLCSPIFM